MAASITIFIYFQIMMRLVGVDITTDLNHVFQSTVIKKISPLSEEIKETSGLSYFNNLLFTHNDAGNKNILYALNEDDGSIRNRFTISGAKNVDWEDLAENDEFIFIGDIGNNDGDRKDLKILKIKKDIFNSKEDKKIPIDEIINFSYGDQKNFNPQKKHNFDSEAMIFFDNNLYLFSKNRGGTLCKVYKIPSKSGTYTAEIIDSFDVSGPITGAAISPSGNRIILTGYNKDNDCFLYSLENFKEDRFFSGKNIKITLGSYHETGQVEGVVFKDDYNIFLSSEKTKNQKPKLFRLKI